MNDGRREGVPTPRHIRPNGGSVDMPAIASALGRSRWADLVWSGPTVARAGIGCPAPAVQPAEGLTADFRKTELQATENPAKCFN
jgi:hypothetical protein